MSEAEDPGARALRRLYELLQVDDEWSAWANRGFTWWPWAQAQYIGADEPREDHGVLGARVWVRTDVVRSKGLPPPGGPPRHSLLTEIANRLYAATFAGGLVTTRRDDILYFQFGCSVFVTEENLDWLTRVLSMAAILQAYMAMPQDPPDDDAIYEVAATAHPVSGPRSTPDDMLNAVQSIVIPEGQSESAWANDRDLQAVAEFFRDAYDARVEADGCGLNIEVSLAGLRDVPIALNGSVAAINVCVGESHPVLGNGSLLRMELPHLAEHLPSDPAELLQVALAMNQYRFSPSNTSYCFGGWSVAEAPDGALALAYLSFWPNAVARVGWLLPTIAGSLMTDAKLAIQSMCDQKPWPSP